ncbi:MAG: hypothetical protein JW735_01185 [Prolixibacteraceae bacterium]|nr:hypothetical protein [Prolixibacteraceae bacterium]
MKSIKQFAKYLLIVTVALNFTSCWSFSVDDPELKKQHDSYLTLVEYHALKQVLMYEYFGLFSNDFQNPNLFEYEPAQEECMAYFTKIEQLLAYEEKITEAANSLQNTNSQVLSSDDFLLKSAMAKWDWLLKYVPFKGKNIELRNKIVSMSKDFTDEQRKYLFDLLYANPEWKGGALNETQFFSKMESGELDNSILRIHNTFEEDGERGDYFNWAEENKLLSAQLAYEYGKEGLETGEKVLVTTVENLNPAIGTSIKILDYGNKFLNYINECTNGKTTEQFKEEVKQNIEEKYAESGLEQNQTPQQQALSIVEQAQRLANVAKVNKNPASVVSDVSGWGGVKITSNDQTLIPDVVFAEKLYDEIGANIILATKMLKNELNEWLVPLPEGDWNIVVADNKGRSDTIIDYSSIGKYFGVANVSYNSNLVVDEENEEVVENPDCPQIMFNTKHNYVEMTFLVHGDDYTKPSRLYFNMDNHLNNYKHFDSKEVPLTWNDEGNTFSTSYSYNYTENDTLTVSDVIKLNGRFYRNDSCDINLLLNIEQSYLATSNSTKRIVNFKADMSKISAMVLMDWGGVDFKFEARNVNTENFIDKLDYLDQKYVNNILIFENKITQSTVKGKTGTVEVRMTSSSF